MHDVGGLVAAILVLYASAAAWVALLLKTRLAPSLLRGAAVAVFFIPLLIAPESIQFRALAEVLCVDLFLKLIECVRQRQQAPGSVTWRTAAFLLMPFPLFVAVWEEKRRSPADYSLVNMLRIVLGAGGVAGSCLLLIAIHQGEFVRASFVVDHLVTVACFIVAVESGARMMFGVERLCGFATSLLVRNVFLSITVAEFWLRWNNRVQRWLLTNVYRPAARRFGRTAGIAAVFVFSGLFHELAFAVATSRLDGYQLLFFTAQIPLVLLSGLLRRQRTIVATMASYLLTAAWMTCTSVLFLHGVARVFPFIYGGELWLP